MATEFKLPELGENITSGDLVKLLVKVGDTVAKDQAVLELETEKASIEVPSSVAGRVKEIHVKEGQKVKVGQVVLTLEEAGEQPAAKEAKEEKPKAEKPREEKTEPAPKPKPAEAPRPVEMKRPEAVPPVAREAVARREDTPAPPPPQPAGVIELVPAAPSVRRMARELGARIEDIHGTGPGGRITAEDVKEHVKKLVLGAGTAPATVSAGAIAAPPLPDFSKWGEIERQPMRAVRRATAVHLSAAWANIPHVTQHDKADISALEQLRERYAKKAEAAGGKLTMTAIALKVCAAAIKRFPQFASSVDMARQEVIYKKYTHIGVAVDTDRGLLVPVIRDVDHKNIVQLSAELSQVAEKARNRKLTPEEMEGGVFTITNLGGIGGTFFTPIVNLPEVAILGLSRAVMEPVYRDGQFVPRQMLPLSLSYDHRVIDGADAARFLRWVVEALEQPFLVALEG